MNIVCMTGRLTRDPDVRYSQGQQAMAIVRFTIAVDREYKKDGQPSADFPSCVAFGKTAEFIEKYVKKGTKLEITGRIQTGSYTNKNGEKVYTTDIAVDRASFAESKKANGDQAQATQPAEPEFMDLQPGQEEDLPFN